jgi:hypothetical protein
MGNVVKLVNGGSIQVRTGVIQGIGPVGPRGAVGPNGPQGDQGPTGDTGAMGQILQVGARTDVSTTNALAAATDTVISFGNIKYDDPSCIYTSANILLRDIGDYMLNVYLRFDDAAAGGREVWFASQTAGLIARTSRVSAPGAPFYVDLSMPYRVLAPGNEYLNVLARSAQALNISAGSLGVTRIGSGPVGAQGPIGPQGPPGATGGKGDTGSPGAPGGVYTSYAQLVGH